MNDKSDKPKDIVFFIDLQQHKTTEPSHTVRDLIVNFAKEDPATTTLVLKKGNEQHKYTNLDEIVPLENGMHFTIFHNTPTTVS
jgi:hypothetical protein